MSTPLPFVRKDVQDYLSACEHLLAVAVEPTTPRLSNEELKLLEYYAAEIAEKILLLQVQNRSGISLPELSVLRPLHRSIMSEYRQVIREYIRASEALLKDNGFTDQEKKLIEAVLRQISRELLDGRLPIDGYDVDAKNPATDMP